LYVCVAHTHEPNPNFCSSIQHGEIGRQRKNSKIIESCKYAENERE